MEVADAIVQNSTILRLNLQFNTVGPRVRVTEKLKQNLDARNESHSITLRNLTLFILVRKKRVAAKQDASK